MLSYLECGKGIAGNIERVHLHIVKELVYLVRVKDNLGQHLMSQTLPQDHATVQSNLLVFVPKQIGGRIVLGIVYLAFYVVVLLLLLCQNSWKKSSFASPRE